MYKNHTYRLCFHAGLLLVLMACSHPLPAQHELARMKDGCTDTCVSFATVNGMETSPDPAEAEVTATTDERHPVLVVTVLPHTEMIILIRDILGKAVLTESAAAAPSQYRKEIPLTGLTRGVYFADVHTAGKRTVTRFTVK